MLDKLIISKHNKKDTRKLRSILVSTFVVVMSLLSCALIYSLFSQTLAMGQENLNFSALIAPPAIQDKSPPKPEPVKKRPNSLKTKDSKITIRKKIIAQIDEPISTIPKSVSTDPSAFRSRPQLRFILGERDTDIKLTSRVRTGCASNCGKILGERNDNKRAKSKAEEKGKPIPKPPELKTITRSLGVVNGIAKYLAKPRYSITVQRLGAHGKVTVQVLIDKNGNVISANAISGHKLLRASAVQAARRSKFTPTTLSKVPIRVRGIIVYNFSKN